MLAQPGSTGSAAEPAIKPTVFRNSLLVCFVILAPFLHLDKDYLLTEHSSSAFLAPKRIIPCAAKPRHWERSAAHPAETPSL